MSVVPTPTHSVVEYMTPSARALQTAGNAAIGFGAAVVAVAGPILVRFLSDGDFSKTALTTLVSVIGAAVIGVAVTYATKYLQARGSDVPPTVTPGDAPVVLTGTVEHIAPAVMLPSLPVVDSALLVQLVEAALKDHLAGTGAPPVVTPPPT